MYVCACVHIDIDIYRCRPIIFTSFMHIHIYISPYIVLH